MSTRSLRNRLADTTNIWPGFVDVLATLLIVIIFVLMVFTVSQIYLSDAISGRDKALQDLRTQINELSKILVIETKDKEGKEVVSRYRLTNAYPYTVSAVNYANGPNQPVRFMCNFNFEYMREIDPNVDPTEEIVLDNTTI